MADGNFHFFAHAMQTKKPDEKAMIENPRITHQFTDSDRLYAHEFGAVSLAIHPSVRASKMRIIEPRNLSNSRRSLAGSFGITLDSRQCGSFDHAYVRAAVFQSR